MPTPAATARSYSSGTVAESCSAMPGGVENRDLVVVAPALQLAADHLADLTGEIVLRDQPVAERHVDLTVATTLADVVHEDPRALQDARVELLLALEIGAERREMRAGLDPVVVDDPAARVCPGHDDVGSAHDTLQLRRRLELEVRVERLLLRHEPVERLLRPAPDAHLAEREGGVAGGEGPLCHAPGACDRKHGRVLAREPLRRDGRRRPGAHQRVVRAVADREREAGLGMRVDEDREDGG